jgi:tyrosinase
MHIPKLLPSLALLGKRVPINYDAAVDIGSTTKPVGGAPTTTIPPPSLTSWTPPPPEPTAGSPPPPSQQDPVPVSGCANPRVRREWRKFSTPEKQSYISAIQCLKSLPPRGKDVFSVSENRYDDFLVTHYNKTYAKFDWNGSPENYFGDSDIHQNGLFLPWHRYFLWLYESALINECNYKGAQPFWDWSLDVPQNNGAQWAAAPVFDAATGFGGNGDAANGDCISSGPFAAAGAHVDPGPPTATVLTGGQRCLRRHFDPSFHDAGLGWDTSVMPLLNSNSYEDLSRGYETAPSFPALQSQKFGVHVNGHIGVGGEMSDTMVSPTDPLFYLHHANLDRIWWLWQNKRPENLNAMGWQIFFKKSNTAVPMTLDTSVDVYGFLAPNVPAKAVVDPINRSGDGVMCYVYEKGGFDVPWAVAGQ